MAGKSNIFIMASRLDEKHRRDHNINKSNGVWLPTLRGVLHFRKHCIGALAVVMLALVGKHGVAYLFATVILMCRNQSGIIRCLVTLH